MKKWIFVCIAAFVLMADQSFAEVVVLKSGRAIEGIVTEYADTYIKVDTGEGVIRIPMDKMTDEAQAYFLKQAALRVQAVSSEPEPKVEALKEEKADAEDTEFAPVVAKIDPNVYFREALGFANDQDFTKAVETINKAIALKPDSGKFYFFRGRFEHDRQNFLAAIDDFSRAIQMRPDKPDLYMARAAAYIDLEQVYDAIEDYSEVIDLDPRNRDAFAQRGDLYRDLQRWDLAFADYTSAIKVSPRFGYPYARRASIYFHRGEYRKAWHDVHEAGKRGFHVPPFFIEKLQQAMPDPYYTPKEEPKNQLERYMDFVKDAYENNRLFFMISGGITGVAVLLLLIIFVVGSKIPAYQLRFLSAKDREKAAQEEISRLIDETTPVAYDFHKAGMMKRACAFLIDVGVMAALAGALSVYLGSDYFALIFGVLILLKDCVFGRSIGKIIVGTRVVNERGEPVFFVEALLRNFFLAFFPALFYVLYVADHGKIGLKIYVVLGICVLAYAIEILVLFASRKDGRRIGDFLASTRVHDHRPRVPGWIFGIVLVPLCLGVIFESVGFSLEINKRFLYSLHPQMYYHPGRQCVLMMEKGWFVASQSENQVIFETSDFVTETGQPKATMIILIEDSFSEYPLELCSSFLLENMKSQGLSVLEEGPLTVAGQPAVRVALEEPKEKTIYLMAYFKDGDEGPLYNIQGISHKQYMGKIAPQIVRMVESLHFALKGWRDLGRQVYATAEQFFVKEEQENTEPEENN